MEKIFNYIVKAVSFIFPVLSCIIAEKKINKTIRKLEQSNNEPVEFSYMSNYEKLEKDSIKFFFDKTFENRKTLEEKAKTNVIGITITVSIITGLSKVLYDINNSQNSSCYKISIFILGTIALVNMVISGFLALAVLGKLNIMTEVFPEDLGSEERVMCKNLALYTEINVKYNTIRNNYIYSSYKSIVVSLVCLSIIFLIITLPLKGDAQKILEKNQQKQSESLHIISEKQEKILDKINNIENQIEKNHLEKDINSEISKVKEDQKAILKILRENNFDTK